MRRERVEQEYRYLAECIADNVRREREARGWTRRDLADRLLRNPASVTFVESGASVPSLAKVAALCEALGCPWSALLPDEDWAITTAEERCA